MLLAWRCSVLRRHGWGALQVSFVGKAATLCLLYAFPLLLLGTHGGTSYAEAARVAGWAFAIWGTALYWWAAGLYWRRPGSSPGPARLVTERERPGAVPRRS